MDAWLPSMYPTASANLTIYVTPAFGAFQQTQAPDIHFIDVNKVIRARVITNKRSVLAAGKTAKRFRQLLKVAPDPSARNILSAAVPMLDAITSVAAAGRKRSRQEGAMPNLRAKTSINR